MAHLVNNVHEGFGVADPEESARSTPPQTWVDRLPIIIRSMQDPDKVHAAFVLLHQMAIDADANKKNPGP